MPKFRVTERQILRVDYIVDADDEAMARDLVGAMEASDFDEYVCLEDSEIVLVQEEKAR